MQAVRGVAWRSVAESVAGDAMFVVVPSDLLARGRPAAQQQHLASLRLAAEQPSPARVVWRE